MKTVSDRFYDKIFYSPDGCWYWTGAVDSRNRARLFAYNENQHASRISYLLHKGPIGALFVCHTCDNGLCVNPDHLWLGTHADNQKDKIKKGRHSYCESHAHAKLNFQKVAEIRKLQMAGVNDTVIARQFNVARSTIGSIKFGRTWTKCQSQ